MDSFLPNIGIFFGLMFFAYFSWRKIEFGIYAIIFCLPSYLIRQNIFGIPTTVLELGIYILFIIWLCKNYRRIKPQELIPDKILLRGVFLLLAGAALSTFLSADLRASAGILKGWFFDPFLFFIVLVSAIKCQAQSVTAIKVFSFSGFAAASVSLLYWLGVLPNGVSYDDRLQGVYASSNYLAMYLAIPLLISIWFYLQDVFSAGDEKKGKKGKYFWLAAGFTMAAAVYFTYSYAAWFAIGTSVLLFVYWIIPEEKIKAVFAAFILAFIVLFFTQIGTDKFQNLKNLSYRSSANSRAMIWSAAFMIGRDYPVFGVGPGNFQKYYLDYQERFTEPYLEWAVPEPHNIFLAFWLETGVLGLAGFILILIRFFRSGFLMLKKRPLNSIRGVTIILLSAMAYILLHGLFDTTYWKNDLAMIFWLVLGLMIATKKNDAD